MPDVSQLRFHTNNLHLGKVSSRPPHGNRTVSSDRKFQPDLSLSVFLERFFVCSSETSCTIRLFQFGVPKPLGTHVDRGSAVNHHQTFMGSWVPCPGCLFMGSWVLILGCFLFFNFIYSATTLAQVYNIDFVFNQCKRTPFQPSTLVSSTSTSFTILS